MGLIACGNGDRLRAGYDPGDESIGETQAYASRSVAGDSTPLGGSDWTPVLADGAQLWLAMENHISESEVCYALRTVNDLSFADVAALRAGPWPTLPSEPGFVEAREPASCVSEGLLANVGIEGLSFDFTEDGTSLLLGVVDQGSTLQSVIASSHVEVLTQGEVFLVIGNDSSIRLTAFTLEHEGHPRTCTSPDFILGDVTIICDSWTIGGDEPA
ncbi:MAG: hypothetical protein AB7L84_03925 [Acidimicrobiia bacterium]